MHHLLINEVEVGHHRLLELGQGQQQGVVDQDRQVDQDHHHGDGHRQLLEIDQDRQLDRQLQQTAILTAVSVVKVWD
jgi:hypothetical protein